MPGIERIRAKSEEQTALADRAGRRLAVWPAVRLHGRVAARAAPPGRPHRPGASRGGPDLQGAEGARDHPRLPPAERHPGRPDPALHHVRRDLADDPGDPRDHGDRRARALRGREAGRLLTEDIVGGWVAERSAGSGERWGGMLRVGDTRPGRQNRHGIDGPMRWPGRCPVAATAHLRRNRMTPIERSSKPPRKQPAGSARCSWRGSRLTSVDARRQSPVLRNSSLRRQTAYEADRVESASGVVQSGPYRQRPPRTRTDAASAFG